MAAYTISRKMKDCEPLDPKASFWAALDDRHRMPAGYDGADVLALTAGFFLLRWASVAEAERQAIAEFDGEEFVPSLPEAMRWEQLVASLPRVRWEKLAVLAGVEHGESRLAHLISRVGAVLRQRERLPQDLVHRMFEWTSQFAFETVDERREAGRVLDQLTDEYQKKRQFHFGEYCTPNVVADLMVELLDPKPGERIYDPCFGTGRVLLGCARRVQEQARLLPAVKWAQLRENTIFGVERNPTAYLIGMARIVLSGIDCPGLELGSALERVTGKNDAAAQFDCVFCDAPMGVRVSSAEASHYPINSTDSLGLFIQHATLALRPGGRAVFMVPNGFLFKTGPDRELRENLLKHFCVEGLIALPEGILRPVANISANLLVVSRKQPATVVRFLRVPRICTEEELPDSACKESELPRPTAAKFWTGQLNTLLWETPIVEIARRDWDLQIHLHGDDQLQHYLQELTKTDVWIENVPLSEVAELVTGVSYDRKRAVEKRADGALGLIRVADIAEKTVKNPLLFVMPEAIPGSDRKRIKAGDVLISAGGTIGKSGVVGESQAGSIPSKSVIALRCSERVLPGYLNGLLQSAVYREWIAGHARGTTIKNLSSRALSHMPVPLPPLPLQQRLAAAWEAKNLDVAKGLLRALAGEESNPFTEWTHSDEVAPILKGSDGAAEARPGVLLDRLARGLQNVVKQLADGEGGHWPEDGSRLTLNILEAGCRPLIGLAEIPPGPMRYSILEKALQLARNIASDDDDTDVVLQVELRTVAEAVERLVNEELAPLLIGKTPDVAADPQTITAGDEASVSLRMVNPGLLPLRALKIRTKPDVGQHAVEYLAEKSEASFPLRIPPQVAAGKYAFVASWTAQRMDGSQIDGEAELTIAVVSGREGHFEENLGSSPYNGQDAVDRPEMFYGREPLMARITAELGKAQPAKVILLEGNRRMGKTSILKRVLAVPPAGWLPIYCNFQGGIGSANLTGLADREIFRLMARDIGWGVWKALQIATWTGERTGVEERLPFKKAFSECTLRAFRCEHPMEVFELYLETVLEAIRPRRLLLLLDEFDKIHDGIRAGTTNPIVPENLRYLLNTYAEFGVVLAGSKRLKKLREDYWSALFGLGERLEVGPLDRKSAEALITVPVRDRLIYAPAAVTQMGELCAFRPNLIQSFCNQVFALAQETGLRSVSLNTVENLANEKMTRENEHFATLWGYAGTERRRLILSLCAHESLRGTPATFTGIEETLLKHHIFFPKGEKLEEDFPELIELELIVAESTANTTTYRIAVPLFERWIMNNHGDLEMLYRSALREAEEKQE